MSSFEFRHKQKIGFKMRLICSRTIKMQILKPLKNGYLDFTCIGIIFFFETAFFDTNACCTISEVKINFIMGLINDKKNDIFLDKEFEKQSAQVAYHC